MSRTLEIRPPRSHADSSARSGARLAIIATHPIQYYAPLFRLLTSRGNVDVRVFYGWEGATTKEAFDPGFGQSVKWDIPLLDGYDHVFVRNTSRDPGTHHFRGIISDELIPQVSQWRPDVVLVYGWSYQAHLAALRYFHGRVPVFFRGDSTLLDETLGIKVLLRRLWLAWVYRHVDCALFVGTENKSYYRRHGVGEDRLVWAPHSVDNDRFADVDGRAQREADEWRRSLGIEPSAQVLLFAAKLERRKAPDRLLDAFLRRARDDEHLIIAGVGELEGRLREMASGRSNVHFIGFQNQSAMPTVYRLGDALVLPSLRGETWGLAVNEAMASQRPVIVSDRVGCASDLVAQRGTGIVYPAADANGLERALARMLDDPPPRMRMGVTARQLIESWSLAVQAERIEQAVCSTTGRVAPHARRQGNTPNA